MSDQFRAALGAWFARGHRDLPWRRTRDPYRIWLSEIMLQQTRAAAATPYYEAFLRQFPTVEALARAPQSDVLAAWSGLGYYSRARNLRAAAIQIAGHGGFPHHYAGIAALPGVGPYTAAAVASIAFGLPYAVLDGNVMRVIARVTADEGDIGSPATRKRFQAAADALLDRDRPGPYNQAIMELGATVCLPREPLCLVCPVAAHCEAYGRGLQKQLPVKLKKSVPVEEAVELALMADGGKVLLRQREESSSRLAGFWELPPVKDVPGFAKERLLGGFTHTIVNHRYRVSVLQGQARQVEGAVWVKLDGLEAIPITTMTRKALRLLKNRESLVQTAGARDFSRKSGV